MSFTAWPYPAPSTDAVTSVGVQGDRFTVNGKIQNLRGFTDFAGLDVYRRTGALSPLAQQMQQLHHDFVSLSVPALTPRILLMKNGGSLFGLDPRTMPDFFDVLPRHADAMQAAKFVPLYVLLADCFVNGMSLGYQQDFVGRAADRLRGRPVLVELVNEYDNGPQHVDPLAFTKPDGLVISRGSPAESGPIPWPAWDFITIRSRRDAKWLQTISDSAYSFRAGDWGGQPVPITCPVFDSEPRGAGTSDPKRYTSTEEAFRLGLESAAWNHAGVFHCDAGLTSSLLPPVELNAAICFFRGMLAVPETP
jgi:hypothetical protein